MTLRTPEQVADDAMKVVHEAEKEHRVIIRCSENFAELAVRSRDAEIAKRLRSEIDCTPEMTPDVRIRLRKICEELEREK